MLVVNGSATEEHHRLHIGGASSMYCRISVTELSSTWGLSRITGVLRRSPWLLLNARYWEASGRSRLRRRTPKVMQFCQVPDGHCHQLYFAWLLIVGRDEMTKAPFKAMLKSYKFHAYDIREFPRMWSVFCFKNFSSASNGVRIRRVHMRGVRIREIRIRGIATQWFYCIRIETMWTWWYS